MLTNQIALLHNNQMHTLVSLVGSYWNTVGYVGGSTVKENDFLVDGLPAYRALGDLISAQLAGAVAAQEHTVLPPVHAHLTLGLGGGGGGRGKGGGVRREHA